MSEEERCDPTAAAKLSRQSPRLPGNLPHHLRCDWMRGEERCKLGDGHVGEHKYEESK